MKNVVWFEDLSKSDVGIAGGKGASLGEMIKTGLPVPDGFAVTAQAYEKFVTEAGIIDEINDLLKKVDVDNSEALSETGEKIRNTILNAEMPEDVRKDIIKAYNELSERTGEEDVSVAVRSSATAEDMPDASFAGQQETYLHIKGEENLIKNVQKCWSSLFTDRAIFYREKNNYAHEDVLISVPIQKMVNAEKAGVLFTSHPSTGEEDKVVIEANWGLGETVVSGSVTPDTYVVDKKTKKIIEKTIGTKEAMIVRNPETGTTIEKSTPSEKREAQVIDEEEAAELAELGAKLQEHYGRPQDAEWAEEDGKIYLVQSRPITVLYKEEEEKEEKETEEAEILLKGLGASPGRASGKVKTIPDVKEIGRVKEGDILVAEMTAPDWVPAMRRAAAIVTDEGGTTCFTGDTRVLTDRGILPIDEIYNMEESNIRVLTVNPDSLTTEWKSVLGSTKRTSQVWEVSVSQTGRSKRNTLKATPDHGMMIFEDRKLIEKELRDVIDESEMVSAVDFIPTPIAHDGGEVHSEDLAYLSGALASDGCIELSSRRGRVTFRQKNTLEKSEFIDTVRKNFRQEFGTELVDRGEDESVGVIRGNKVNGKANRYECQRKEPAERLLDIENNLQEFILRAEKEIVASFLAGFIDGDGSFNDSHENGRVHIYANDEMAEAIILACLRLRILPQVYENRNIYNIQIVEGLEKILELTHRVGGKLKDKTLGTKLLPARQILQDIVDQVNTRGKTKPYVQKNLLIDSDKLEDRTLPELSGKEKEELERLINSDLRGRRIKKVQELGEKPVYNLEVEDNHNYVVFTEHLTPILVHNCHAAIVSRELGTPAVVGTGNATEILEDEMEVTVDGASGAVYKGIEKVEEKVEEKAPTREVAPSIITTGTEVKVNISLPDIAKKVSEETQADGVGLLRAEHMLLTIGKHPRKILEEGGEDLMIEQFSEGVRTVAKEFSPKSVWYRTLDLKTAEFKNLEGGEEEPDEPNPMIGWRGVRRFVDPDYPKEQEILKIELKALKKVAEEGYTNVGVMLPMAQHPEELKRFKRVAREVGLEPHEDIDVGIMIEIPAAALIIDEFIEEGIDFVSFGTNDLTQFTLAVDRDNERIAKLYDERHPAVQRLIREVIEKCNEAGVESSVCGQAGSYPDVVEKLVNYGITSVSANPDAVKEVRRMVDRTERKLMLKNARERLKNKD
ncbi:hypothetical protein AKJ37_01280 [candidate division MSBL1 archaeon SCGC-AAA259I09]|uniref:Probable phosphoenolpyruvate synthase n=1 Tax=candidate division MSBL1 archaeon SCGC-AAA259I09 TaxID=1698267 RepID=A0A133UV84_9EURY|nr:hypothetical protein AKJ37_01280 [candidate division MSBL1 archaeon SCGC-AAA259I09]